MSKIVAIVGRPNVGKSTLFNRLTGQRKAIVDDISGVTRDRHYGTCEWLDNTFTVIDTGGYVPDSSDIFESSIREQVQIAIDESDILIFVVDLQTDITDLDMTFANIIRKTKKPVLVVVNKVDTHEKIAESAVFYRLGFGELFAISSMTGSGTGDLLDRIVELLKGNQDNEITVEEDENIPKVAIIGRPNVGKSSFVNALLGYNRNIVTDIAGTTRDSIHTRYNAFNQELLLVDTAGIRKKNKVKDNIEFYSVMRSLRALEQSDVVVLMLDATLGLESQDINLFHLADKNGKGIVILVNKWDLVEKNTQTAKEYTDNLQKSLAPFTDLPILFVSATNKQRIFQAVEAIVKVYENMKRVIATHELNEFILPIIENYPPPARKGKHVQIKYATQLKTKQATFIFFCNLPQYVYDPYKRFLENKIRETYDFKGVPLKLFFRKK